MKLPFLLSVPHGGERIPGEAAPYCVLTTEEIVADSDEGARLIYSPLSDAVEVFIMTDTARAIIDLNRAEDDFRQDGVVKTHTCHDIPVYGTRPPEETIERLIDQYYRPYHRRLTESAASGRVIMGVDCHTMLAIGPPIGPMAGLERPLICLSDVDGTTCPGEWFEALGGCLEDAFGCPVARNHPFKGGYITRSHSREMPWVQLELSRAPFLPSEEKGQRVLKALRRFAASRPASSSI